MLILLIIVVCLISFYPVVSEDVTNLRDRRARSRESVKNSLRLTELGKNCIEQCGHEILSRLHNGEDDFEVEVNGKKIRISYVKDKKNVQR